MIAIPVDAQTGIRQPVSQYYGHVGYFALYDNQGKLLEVIASESKGSGEGISRQLAALGVTRTLFRHLGDKLYGWLQGQGIEVYALEARSFDSDQAALALAAGRLPLVTAQNAKALLDPAGKGDGCSCGCSHS